MNDRAPGPRILEDLGARLRLLEDEQRARKLSSRVGIDFCSNDYLGFATSAALARSIAERISDSTLPLGAPASRLLGGTTDAHAHLEARLARFKDAEAALLFPSGYQANLALITALVGSEDRVLSDALNHASLIDGVRLARPRGRVTFPHLDPAAVARTLDEPHSTGHTFLLTEAVFSMDGDRAPLDAYAELCRRAGAGLIVDEAHATGLYGARGSGVVEELGLSREVLATVTTFGKSLGFAGACVSGPRVLIDTLVQRSRPLIYSTAVPPLLLCAVEAALDLLEADPTRGRRASALAERLRRRLRGAGLDVRGKTSPIVPVVLGDEARTLQVGAALARRGFAVGAVRAPTVPLGSARLRISVHADRSEEEVDALAVAVLAEVCR